MPSFSRTVAISAGPVTNSSAAKVMAGALAGRSLEPRNPSSIAAAVASGTTQERRQRPCDGFRNVGEAARLIISTAAGGMA